MVDLSQFDSITNLQNSGIEIDILHPKTGEPFGIKIKVAGPESDRQKKFRNNLINDRLRQRNARSTAASLDSEAVRLTASAIISWSGIMIGDKSVEMNQKNAEMILRDYPFIREQVDSVAGDRSAFIKD